MKAIATIKELRVERSIAIILIMMILIGFVGWYKESLAIGLLCVLGMGVLIVSIGLALLTLIIFLFVQVSTSEEDEDE